MPICILISPLGSDFKDSYLVWRAGTSIKKPQLHSPSFPRRRESRFLGLSWIPGRASYRQLARNDDRIFVANFWDRHSSVLLIVSRHCLIRGCSKTFHGCADSFAVIKNCRPGDQNVGSCIDHQWCSRRVDAAINLEIAAGPDLIDHLADTANLRQRRVDEMLMSKARVDRHD